MKLSKLKNRIGLALVIAAIGMLSAGNAMANIVVDPKGHDSVQLERDIMECRELASSIDFNLAEEHQGRAVLRGAVIGGSAAAIAGGGKEMRRRSAAGGALMGGVARNKSKRVDGSVEQVKINDAQRNCLIGRGYNPLS